MMQFSISFDGLTKNNLNINKIKQKNPLANEQQQQFHITKQTNKQKNQVN